jgi:SAM-dependent methyltransferase
MTAVQHEWQKTEHAKRYLARAERVSHRREGEAELVRQLPADAQWVLDLGTGDGRLAGLVKEARPGVQIVAVDFSPTMLEAARRRFAGDESVVVVTHDLREELPDLGQFDAVVSSFAIHHVPDGCKERLYGEVYEALAPGGVFLNLEHVAPVSAAKHEQFLAAMGITPELEDKTNLLAPAEVQLAWLRRIGFVDVDCDWKWLELALLTGRRGCEKW